MRTPRLILANFFPPLLRLYWYPKRTPPTGQRLAEEGTQRIYESPEKLGLWGLIEAAALAYVVFNSFLSSSILVGPSMLPTFRPQGDVVLVERISHHWQSLQPGEFPSCMHGASDALSMAVLWKGAAGE